ncbi:DNA primase small subunit-like [Trichogramma pretiosum]|uniref:DNA primase small subunit-like n=1 Tax=Trichogramma pretiosum TaxID=7493 RepID=UPI0006C9B24F|nr:DNA primase small subunit-like [Trichogramma pretiosum]
MFKPVLPLYYARIFPFDEIHRWLSYGEDELFLNREFALNFDGERFLRYQFYKDAAHLKREIKSLRPTKIDIGAIYNKPPKKLDRESIFPVNKEFIIDIDITDYDDVRTCCSEANICNKCWKFMALAMQILDEAFREDFGFQHILWTFSGRRGVHCWVCDESARQLKKQTRFSVASYLQVVTGGVYRKKKVDLKEPIHPFVRRVLDRVQSIFIDMCVIEQNILGTNEMVSKFLEILNNLSMRTEVHSIFKKYTTSLERWLAFVECFRTKINNGSEEWNEFPFLIEEIMLQYTYPRLDINVTLGLTHLLKSPFSVHPDTGKIGIPLDIKTIENFDIKLVPNVFDIFDQVDAYDLKAKNQDMAGQVNKKVSEIEKTNLNQYLKIFREFIDELEKDKTEKEMKEEIITESQGLNDEYLLDT